MFTILGLQSVKSFLFLFYHFDSWHIAIAFFVSRHYNKRKPGDIPTKGSPAFHCDITKAYLTLIVNEVTAVPEPQAMPMMETRLGPELMAEVYKALNFEPSAFAKRHGDEFTHLYLRIDRMLSYTGEEIFSYLSPQVNECLSKAEYALLSYMEYAGRTQKVGTHDRFAQAVTHYLTARRQAGSDWLYAFEKEDAKKRCLETYPQMYLIAQAMYAFAKEVEEFKEIAMTDGPDAWPDAEKI